MNLILRKGKVFAVLGVVAFLTLVGFHVGGDAYAPTSSVNNSAPTLNQSQTGSGLWFSLGPVSAFADSGHEGGGGGGGCEYPCRPCGQMQLDNLQTLYVCPNGCYCHTCSYYLPGWVCVPECCN